MTRSVSAATGALIVIGMRWTDRLIGLISTVILARLLVPEDFGIIAMASIVVGVADVLLDVGVNITLIQNRNATQEDYNAAWTIRLLQAVLGGLLVLALAEPAAAYFKDERVADVTRVMALSLILAGCENIGVVNFQKGMEFGREFRFFFLKRVTGFTVTMVAAYLLHSYWAMVIGALSGRFAGVLLSYWLHPMRPRASLARVKSMIAFSSWNLFRGMAGYGNENLHRIIVGRRESPAMMGAYSLGCDIAALPSSELLAPLSRVLFPMFASLQGEAQKLKRAFLLALGIQALVGIPAGIGLALVADELVRAMLGEKWLAAIPIIQLIGVVNVVQSIGASTSYLLLAMGKARITAINAWAIIVLFLILVLFVFPDGDALTIAGLRLAVATFGMLILFNLAKHHLAGLRTREMLLTIWRPSIAAAIMALVLTWLPIAASLPVVAQLLIKVASVGVSFVLGLLVLWRMVGCPHGAESYLLGKLKLDRLVARLLRQPAQGEH